MNHSLTKNAGRAAVRSLALFLTFALITFVASLIFRGNLFDEEMLSERAVGMWNFAFLLFIFESTCAAWNRHATSAREPFFAKYAQGRRFGKVKSVFLSVDLYVEFACIALLSAILPLSLVYDCVGLSLFGEGYGKAQVLPVILPILLVLEILAHLSARSAWVVERMQTKGSKDKNELAQTVKGLATVAIVYLAAALVIPWGLPFLVTIGNLGSGAVVFLYIGIALLVAALAVVVAFYVRAILKRREFVRQLTKVCREQSATLSDVKKPCLSVLFQQKGVDFTVEYKGAVHACKLVASVFPTSPIVFSDTGEGIRQDTLRLFKINLLHLNTLLDFRMEDAPADSRKIVIVLPVPNTVYVSTEGSTPRPADTGERMGAYTLYTATGFLNALDRGNLG